MLVNLRCLLIQKIETDLLALLLDMKILVHSQYGESGVDRMDGGKENTKCV